MSLSIGHEAFLFICLPGPSLLVPCSISINLSPSPVTGGVRPCPLAMKHFYSFVSQLCHCWCPPFFRRQCSISIHLSTRSVTAASALFCGHALVSQVCHCWCPPFSAGDARFLFIGAAALFRWPCSISIHLSPMQLLSFCLSGLVPALLFSAA